MIEVRLFLEPVKADAGFVLFPFSALVGMKLGFHTVIQYS